MYEYEYVQLNIHPCTPRNSYISIYFGHKTLFSPNVMIINMGTFRNTSNYMNNAFHIGSSAYYQMLSLLQKL